MGSKSKLLRFSEHRPYPPPQKPWLYYQEWHNVLMLHWKIPVEKLRPLLPYRLKPDLFNGDAWVSLVAFTGKKLHPRFLLPFAPVSDFNEINIRTYVVHNNKPGIYFLSLEAEKKISAWLARFVTGMPYIHSDIKFTGNSIHSDNKERKYFLNTTFEPGLILPKDALDTWLTERYCVYNEKRRLYSFDIHHAEWPLQHVSLQETALTYDFRKFKIDHSVIDRVHFAKGLKVLLWAREIL